ncbi:MAG: glycosyltransferase family 4 protein [FCB group bacterium]|nr:glycosyltransferase family 4 protein [FCB group bacterium]
MIRPRVLLIAEAANPEWASVPLVGWSHARALAGVADVHLVTQIRNREAILRAGLVEGHDFTAIDSEAVAKRLYNLSVKLRGGESTGWTTGTALSSLSYYYFEHVLWQTFGKRIRAKEFDVVHRLTPLSPTAPSIIAAKCRGAGVPFMLGPLNGGVPWPKEFQTARRKEREWLSYLRSAYRLLPGYASTRRNAAAIIMASMDTRAQLPERYQAKCVYIPENAIDPDRFTVQVERPIERPLRVAFVGRLVPYKGADMLLEAAAPLVRTGRVVVDILGDGPEMESLRSFVNREDLASGIRLDGWVEHSKLQYRLCESDVFAFPSIREFGGGVVLEAMALGLVPIVADYAGPRELVSQTTGYRVPLGPRDVLIQRFRDVLSRLADDPSEIREMGQRARARVFSKFTWNAKARQVLEVYRWVMGERPDKPDFGMPFPDEAIAD